jgi:hypothetical protein
LIAFAACCLGGCGNTRDYLKNRSSFDRVAARTLDRKVWRPVENRSRPADVLIGRERRLESSLGRTVRFHAQIRMIYVPYKGTGQSVLAIVTGEVSLGFNDVMTNLPHMKTGRLIKGE